MHIAEGFPGQRLFVLPHPQVSVALNQPGTSHLVVTACGSFPHARSHGFVRAEPISQAVILVCADGGGWCETPAGRFPVRAGQVVVLPPDHPHAYGADEENPWTLWWLHVAGRDLSEFLDAADMTMNAPVRDLPDLYGIVALVTEVVQRMERDSTNASLLAAAGAAWHVMALLASARSTSSSARNALIDEAAAYLRAHYLERTSVAELAARANLSPSHFAALFAKQIGEPVLRYQTQLRMTHARELLDTTGYSIARVGELVGYSDGFYFSRQFREVHGMTARQYRAQNKG